jgi:hypothetical protein
MVTAVTVTFDQSPRQALIPAPNPALIFRYQPGPASTGSIEYHLRVTYTIVH